MCYIYLIDLQISNRPSNLINICTNVKLDDMSDIQRRINFKLLSNQLALN